MEAAEARQEEAQVHPQEEPKQEEAQPKGQPDVRQAYERVKRERHEIASERDMLKRRLQELEGERARISRERVKLGDSPDDFPTAGKVERVLEVLIDKVEGLESQVVQEKQRGTTERIRTINEDGAKRFPDFMDVVGNFSQDLSNDPDGMAIFRKILNHRDPAAYAYRLAGGDKPDLGTVKATETEEEVIEPPKRPKTLGGVPTGGGSLKTTLKTITEMSNAEYQKFRESGGKFPLD